MDVICFDAGQAGFPPAAVPVLQRFDPRALRWHSGAASRPAAPEGRRFWHFQRGRYALRGAYQLAGVQPGDSVLLPAYHCRTMLDPALALGARPWLYPVTASLQPDLAQLDALLAAGAAAGRRARALVLTHFFGMAQPTEDLQALCRHHALELIEDCSHALVLDPADNDAPALADGIGCHARIGVASPYKFMASQDGGLLWADPGLAPAWPALRRAPWSAEWRAAAHLLRQALSARPSPHAGGDDSAWQARQQPVPDRVIAASQPSDAYELTAQSVASLASTRWLMRHTPLAPVAARRRQCYAQWAQAVRGLPGCQALRAELGPTTVPYMFPLLLDSAWPAFHALKHHGLPIWRWDQMAVSDCSVASAYRLRLLHLPCHQGLSDAQMDWMTGTLRTVMRSLGAGAVAAT